VEGRQGIALNKSFVNLVILVPVVTI